MVSPKRLRLLWFFFGVIILAGCGELAVQDTASLFFPGFQRSKKELSRMIDYHLEHGWHNRTF